MKKKLQINIVILAFLLLCFCQGQQKCVTNLPCPCQQDQIFDFETQTCISAKECKYLRSNCNCCKECASDEYTVFQDDIPYQKCMSSCPKGTYEQSNNFQICKSRCGANEIRLQKTEYNTCIKILGCSLFVSMQGDQCLKTCDRQEYPQVHKDGLMQCSYCSGYIDGSKCLKECTDPHPFYQTTYYDQLKQMRQCFSSDQCDQSNNKIKNGNLCYSNCPANQYYHEFSSQKFECLQECPQTQIARYNSTYLQVKCQNECDGKFKSFDNKICLDKCSDIFQLEQQGQTQCLADCQDLNKQKVFLNKTIQCLDQPSTIDELKQRILAFNSQQRIIMSIQYDYIVNAFKNILIGMQNLGVVSQDILYLFNGKFITLSFDISFQERVTVIESKDIKFISQFPSQFYDNWYDFNFNYTKVRAQGASLTIPSSYSYVENLSINPLSLQIFLFDKNFWCKDSKYKDKCFEDQKIIQIFYGGQIQPFIKFSIIFDIDPTKDSSKYVCLTTSQFITRSIKTEVLENPKGIKCTFKNNTALFYDKDGVFQDIICAESQPYKTEEGTCTDKCPFLVDPITKNCVSDISFCTILSGDSKSCVSDCLAPDYPYKKFVKDTQQFICLQQCEGLITDEKKKQCFTMNECKNYLIDRMYCSEECPPENFKFQNETTPYRLCNQYCLLYILITNGNNSKNICINECPQENIYVTLDKKNSIIQKYCGGCPPEFPFAQKQSQQNVCISKCKPNQIYDKDENKCLDSIDQCTKYLVDQKWCQADCPKEYYRFQQEKTPYRQCNSTCELFKAEDNQKLCISGCQDGQILDKINKYCYKQRDQCPQLISSDGKECVPSCLSDIEYQEKNQCMICKRYIVNKVIPNGGQPTYQCTDGCQDSQMIFIFYKQQQQFKKCVETQFCQSQKISQQNPKVCSSDCLIPELKNGDKCVINCPEGTFFQVSSQSCEKSCDKFISSDGKSCLDQCLQVLEITDESVKDQKKCKKCNSNQFLQIQKDQTICANIAKTDDVLDQMKNSLITKLDKDINTKKEADTIKDALGVYADQIKIKLADISNKAETSEQEKKDAQKSFENIITIVQQFSTKVNSQLSLQPEKIIKNELNIVYQVAQPGKKFKTTFNSAVIKDGTLDSMLEEDLEENSTKFKPQNLQVSFVKTNPYCNDKYCKNTSLFIVTFTAQVQNRILANDILNSSTFTMNYPIPQDQQAEKQVCFSYDKLGNRKENLGQLSNGQIICSFEYSSSIFYDENCQFVSENYCKLKPDQKKENDEGVGSSNLSGGAIAGIVIGIAAALVIIIFSIIYILKKRKAASQNIQDTLNNVPSKNNLQTEFAVSINQSQDYEITQQQL